MRALTEARTEKSVSAFDVIGEILATVKEIYFGEKGNKNRRRRMIWSIGEEYVVVYYFSCLNAGYT